MLVPVCNFFCIGRDKYRNYIFSQVATVQDERLGGCGSRIIQYMTWLVVNVNVSSLLESLLPAV